LADFFVTRVSDDAEEQGEGYDKGVEGTWGEAMEKADKTPEEMPEEVPEDASEEMLEETLQ
jgi:hypothetical protein